MKILLMLLLAMPVAAELPQQVNDTAIMENEEFILQQVVELKKNAIGNSAVLTATQTFTGANTFYSDVVFSSSVALPNRDKITFGNELHNSSSTTSISYNTTSAALSVCAPGSTITVTTNGGRLMVGFAGSVANTIPSYNYVAYLVDGVSVGGYVVAAAVNSNNAFQDMSFTRLTDPLAAGVHSVCLTLSTNAGTSYFLDEASGYRPQFWVQELR